MVGGCADYDLNPEAANALRHLCFLISRYFVAPVYTCSASASRWDVGSSFDGVAAQCRDIAFDYGVVSRTGERFWDNLRPFCLYYKSGIHNSWHHGEAGGAGPARVFP